MFIPFVPAVLIQVIDTDGKTYNAELVKSVNGNFELDILIGHTDDESLLLYNVTDGKGKKVAVKFDMEKARFSFNLSDFGYVIYLKTGSYCDYLLGNKSYYMISPFIPLNVFGEYPTFRTNEFYSGWNDGENSGSQISIRKAGAFTGIITPLGLAYQASQYEDKPLFVAFGYPVSRVLIRSYIYLNGVSYEEPAIDPNPLINFS